MTTGDSGIIAQGFDYLVQWGLLDIVIPFVLFYAIVFGMLERTQLFMRKDQKEPTKQLTNLHSLIAFAIAITATGASQLIGITRNYLPVLAVVSLILIGVMLVLAMAFGEQFEAQQQTNLYKYLGWGFAGIALMAGGIIAFYYSGLLVEACDGTNDATCTPLMSMTSQGLEVLGIRLALTQEMIDIVLPIIVVVAIIGIVMMATRPTKK